MTITQDGGALKQSVGGRDRLATPLRLGLATDPFRSVTPHELRETRVNQSS